MRLFLLSDCRVTKKAPIRADGCVVRWDGCNDVRELFLLDGRSASEDV